MNLGQAIMRVDSLCKDNCTVLTHKCTVDKLSWKKFYNSNQFYNCTRWAPIHSDHKATAQLEQHKQTDKKMARLHKASSTCTGTNVHRRIWYFWWMEIQAPSLHGLVQSTTTTAGECRKLDNNQRIRPCSSNHNRGDKQVDTTFHWLTIHPHQHMHGSNNLQTTPNTQRFWDLYRQLCLLGSQFR